MRVSFTSTRAELLLLHVHFGPAGVFYYLLLSVTVCYYLLLSVTICYYLLLLLLHVHFGPAGPASRLAAAGEEHSAMRGSPFPVRVQPSSCPHQPPLP